MSSILIDYLKDIELILKSRNYTEHSFRPTLKQLLEKFERNIVALNEPKRIECGIPDFLIYRKINGLLTIGYIETKTPDMNINNIETNEQIRKYLKAINSLIVTNYLEFRWYVNGELKLTGEIASLSNGNLVVNKQGVLRTKTLLEAFINHRLEPINSAKELAEKMAQITVLIRETILTAFKVGVCSDVLRELRQVFKEVLIPHQSDLEFADMFSQTIAYGLFAARLNHDDSKEIFQRSTALINIPKNYLFLRKLFSTIAGPELEDEPYGSFVNDLTHLLSVIDKETIIKDFTNSYYSEDPIFHFYETFLTAYDPELREKRGIYYTPNPVVSYIVRSVDHLLKTYFCLHEGISESGLMILDPACGSGTFLYSVIDLIREKFIEKGNAGKWQSYVKDLISRVFGFEIIMAPYTIAHLKLSMQLSAVDLPKELRRDWAYKPEKNESLGIYLTNTLEEGIKKSSLPLGSYITDEANSAIKVKKDLPIMVVLGNPPYHSNSINNNTWIKSLVQDYYKIDGSPLKERNSKWLQDDYVKFIRFGQLRIEKTGSGILAFITNHGFLKNPTFRGMRQQLLNSFTDIYILDLHGNSNYREFDPNGNQDENVFDIRTGVSINIFVKKNSSTVGNVYHSELWGTRDMKYVWLLQNDFITTRWEKLNPKPPYYLFKPINIDLHQEYENNWKLTNIFMIHGVGIRTSRDYVVIDFQEQTLLQRVEYFQTTSDSNPEICSTLSIPEKKGWDITKSRNLLKSEDNLQKFIKPISYRPFDNRLIFYHDSLVERTSKRLMKHMEVEGNVALISARSNKSQQPDHFFCTRIISEAKCAESTTQSALFPLYVWQEHKGNTKKAHNINAKFINYIENKLNLSFINEGAGDLVSTIGPTDIFYYIYAIVYSPSYRNRYAEFFKFDFPHIPFTNDINIYKALRNKGAELTSLHLMEGRINDILEITFPIPGSDIIEEGFPRYLTSETDSKKGKIYINKGNPKEGIRAQFFDGIPTEIWNFRIGGYQIAKKWLKDHAGRKLNINEINHFEKVLSIISETLRIMAEIDYMLPEWPFSYIP